MIKETQSHIRAEKKPLDSEIENLVRKSIEYSRTPFEALIPDREEWEQGRPGTTDEICFYTDGSKLEGQVGAGVYSEQLDIRKSFRLPDHCSLFQAEVHAIKEALTCLGNLSLQRGHLNIYIDSQAAIKSIYSTNTNSRTIADCRRSLHEMANHFTISLIWVPGHRDIVGNSIAVELARQGHIKPLLPVHLVVSSIEKSLTIKEYTLIAFLDIEVAFNNVLPTALTESLTELGVQSQMIGLIHKLLISRMVTATLGTSTQTRLVNRGAPQGGVLSPLLWNIAVDKLLRILEGGG